MLSDGQPRRGRAAASAFCAALIFAGLAFPLPARASSSPVTICVSLAPNGTEGNGNSYSACLSADGRVMAFASYAYNLVPGDLHGKSDVFVRDNLTGRLSLVSVSTDGAQGNADSAPPVLNPGLGSFYAAIGLALSRDGRYVTFASTATNLVPNDANQATDVFVRDLQTGTTTRISEAADGTEANGASTLTAISGNGRYVAYQSAATNLIPGVVPAKPQLYRKDRQTGAVQLVSAAVDGSVSNGAGAYDPALSADGRYVAFYSNATNLVAGIANGESHAYVRDVEAATGAVATVCVSVAPDGTQGNKSSGYVSASGSVSRDLSISGDGRYVLFESEATNLVVGDTNGWSDVFLRDVTANTTTRVSVTSSGAQGTNYSGIWGSSLSDGARFVAFNANARLTPGQIPSGDSIYLRDVTLGVTSLGAVSTDGTPENSYAPFPALSADARYVAFESGATNLVPGVTNSGNIRHVYLRGPLFNLPGFGWEDVAHALVLAGGLRAATTDEATRLGGGDSVDLSDAVRLARKVGGLDVNP